ncbi:MAG: PCMD domain-containing protein [Bacteroidota bacterium]|nr:PCMD domain-containing protein [Bacteroidota bacterium]
MKRTVIKSWKFFFFFLAGLLPFTGFGQNQTQIPNADFESWTNYGSYQNPQYWDTPNQYTAPIPFLGKEVVIKSASHHSGSFSAELITQNVIGIGIVPGFITLGKLTVDLTTGAYSVTGGVPVYDSPTHLMGYYKFSPQGGDSCLIGIGLWKWINGVLDTVGYGYFSTITPATDWTPFSAWIDYDTTAIADSMNIVALSSAEETGTSGTTLYVDGLFLDYTLGVDNQDPSTGIKLYTDRETQRILLFFDFEKPQSVSVSVYDMTGRKIEKTGKDKIQNGRQVLNYSSWKPGVYLVEVIHSNMRFCRKVLVNP